MIDSQPMRILQVSSADQGVGAVGSAWQLFQAYRALGHESWLSVGLKYTSDQNVLLIPDHAPGLNLWTWLWLRLATAINANITGKIWGAGTAWRFCRWIGRPKTFMEWKRGIEDFAFPGTRQLLELTPSMPDIVHCHNLHGGYFDLRALPWLSQKAPVILNLRDPWLLSGHCGHSFDCERWKTGCGECPDLQIYPSIKSDATAYNWKRKRDIFMQSRLYISTISQWLMGRVQESMLSGVTYKVIPNGIDLSIFQPGNQRMARIQLGLPVKQKIVLYAANGGGNSRWRDFCALQASMQKIANSNEDELLLLCLGEAKEKKDILEGQLRIKFIKFERNPKRMAEYYQAADVYALPALAEAFGKTITEAMACGTPVVASKVGGIPEQVKDGVMGFLASISDVDHMASALKLLLFNNDLRQQMGAAAANHAKHHFGIERQVNEFLSWYKEIRQDWLNWRSAKVDTSQCMHTPT